MSEDSPAILELYYWPLLQGRGEYVRLALEFAQVPYRDVARQSAAEGGGVVALRAFLAGQEAGFLPYAPPFVRRNGEVIGQTAVILDALGQELGLAGKGEESRRRALALQLTIADWLSEIHDTHHPTSTVLRYEEQKAAAKDRTRAFLEHRLDKYLKYFERQLASNQESSQPRLIGNKTSYADLSLFQTLLGTGYAFPRAMTRRRYPGLEALKESLAGKPALSAYLNSPRRLAFNETGIFRYYPELDLDL